MLKKIFFFLIIIFFLSCNGIENVDFKREMINFVIKIKNHAISQNSNFGIFPQNGSDLLNDTTYAQTITGIGQEDLYYGFDGDGILTPSNETAYIEANLDILTGQNKLVLVTNYTFDDENVPNYSSAQSKIDDAYSKSLNKGYIPFCTVRNLNYITINPNHEPQTNAVTNWDDVIEFLYILQPPDSMSRADFLSGIGNTDYDLIIMDYSFDGTESGKFTAAEISQLKTQLGGKLLCYLSIGEAENYRYYWNNDWDSNNDGNPDSDAPEWLDIENPNWEGNYKVKYWKEEWQNIVLGYLDKIIEAGFDGVYLDIIDAYEYYEDK